MTASSVPAIKAAIIELIEAAEISGLTVAPTVNKALERSDDVIWMDGKFEATREYDSLGKQPPPMIETPSVKLMIRVIKGGVDSTASEERAFEVQKAVEEALRAGHTKLKGTARWSICSALKGAPALLDNSWGYEMEMTVTAHARI